MVFLLNWLLSTDKKENSGKQKQVFQVLKWVNKCFEELNDGMKQFLFLIFLMFGVFLMFQYAIVNAATKHASISDLSELLLTLILECICWKRIESYWETMQRLCIFQKLHFLSLFTTEISGI